MSNLSADPHVFGIYDSMNDNKVGEILSENSYLLRKSSLFPTDDTMFVASVKCKSDGESIGDKKMYKDVLFRRRFNNTYMYVTEELLPEPGEPAWSGVEFKTIPELIQARFPLVKKSITQADVKAIIPNNATNAAAKAAAKALYESTRAKAMKKLAKVTAVVQPVNANAKAAAALEAEVNAILAARVKDRNYYEANPALKASIAKKKKEAADKLQAASNAAIQANVPSSKKKQVRFSNNTKNGGSSRKKSIKKQKRRLSKSLKRKRN